MPDSSFFMTVKDHSISGETFDLHLNEDWDCLETRPKLQPEKLGKYYKSEDYISHTDNKRNIFEWIYHLVRSLAVKHKVRLINSLQTSSKELLDVMTKSSVIRKSLNQTNALFSHCMTFIENAQTIDQKGRALLFLDALITSDNKGVRNQFITNLDKIVDELAKGRSLNKICRS